MVQERFTDTNDSRFSPKLYHKRGMVARLKTSILGELCAFLWGIR